VGEERKEMDIICKTGGEVNDVTAICDTDRDIIDRFAYRNHFQNDREVFGGSKGIIQMGVYRWLWWDGIDDADKRDKQTCGFNKQFFFVIEMGVGDSGGCISVDYCFK
jgi:hypothetical protein